MPHLKLVALPCMQTKKTQSSLWITVFIITTNSISQINNQHVNGNTCNISFPVCVNVKCPKSAFQTIAKRNELHVRHLDRSANEPLAAGDLVVFIIPFLKPVLNAMPTIPMIANNLFHCCSYCVVHTNMILPSHPEELNWLGFREVWWSPNNSVLPLTEEKFNFVSQ